MSTLYYGEIVAKITAHLYQNPDHRKRIIQVMKEGAHGDDSLWTICADAARVFDKTEDLASDFFIDWHLALEKYSAEILDHFLIGQKPTIPNMLLMASRSLESTIKEMRN